MNKTNLVKDSTELRKAIAENPELPIVVMVGSAAEHREAVQYVDYPENKAKYEAAAAEIETHTAYLEELKAYRSTGYTPEQIKELHDKHWSECRQIALYDDQIKRMQEHIDRLGGIIDGLCGYMGGTNNG